MKIEKSWSRHTEGFTVLPAIYFGRGKSSCWIYLVFLYGRIGLSWELA